MIGEKELAKAMVEATAIPAVAEIAEDELDNDEDVRDDDDVMDDNEEIATDPPEEMTFRSDDDVSPYESD